MNTDQYDLLFLVLGNLLNNLKQNTGDNVWYRCVLNSIKFEEIANKTDSYSCWSWAILKAQTMLVKVNFRNLNIVKRKNQFISKKQIAYPKIDLEDQKVFLENV